jgi:hypothetical protein
LEERAARDFATTSDLDQCNELENEYDDPDLLRDEFQFTKHAPVVRDTTKSNPQYYYIPFSACVHMPFVNQFGEPIAAYDMSASQYFETAKTKQVGITREIIRLLTPAKLAQQMAVFKAPCGKSNSTTLRKYAAFIRVRLTDITDDHVDMCRALSDKLLLFQLHEAEIAKTFKNEHRLNLPKSLVPITGTVEYVSMSAKAESEQAPSEWKLVTTISSAKGNDRAGAKAKRSDGNSSTEKNGRQKRTSQCDKGSNERNRGNSTHIYKAKEDILSTSALDTIGISTTPDLKETERAPANSDATDNTSHSTCTTVVQCAMGDTAQWRSESYSFNLSNLNDWPAVCPSFDFDAKYATLEVSFKVHARN